MHPRFNRKLADLKIEHYVKCSQYGLENLYKMGPSYMVARIVDKSGRLENFLKGKISKEQLKEELEDTAICAILASCMIEEGKPLYVFKEYEEIETDEDE